MDYYYHLLDIKDQLNRIEKLITEKGLSDKWLSLKQAQEYSGLSQSTLRRQIAKGTLKASHKVGKSLIKRSQIDRFLTR